MKGEERVKAEWSALKMVGKRIEWWNGWRKPVGWKELTKQDEQR